MMDTQHSTLRIHTPHSGFPHSNALSVECWVSVISLEPGWYGTFYWASDCWPPWQHQVERSLVCVEGRGRISRSGLTQDIKMGSCIPVWSSTSMDSTATGRPRVRILWRGGVSCPASVYCDGVGCHVLRLYTVTGWGVMSCVCILWRGGVSCPVSVYCDGVGCRALCLRHGISVWQHIGQNTTATSRHLRDMTSDVSKSDVKPKQTNKQIKEKYTQFILTDEIKQYEHARVKQQK